MTCRGRVSSEITRKLGILKKFFFSKLFLAMITRPRGSPLLSTPNEGCITVRLERAGRVAIDRNVYCSKRARSQDGRLSNVYCRVERSPIFHNSKPRKVRRPSSLLPSFPSRARHLANRVAILKNGEKKKKTNGDDPRSDRYAHFTQITET